MSSSRLTVQVADAIRRNGTIVYFRMPAPDGAPPVPPNCTSLVLAAAVAAGASSINVTATVADGQIVPGDILTLAGQKLVVTNTTTATPENPVFAGVAFVPPLAAALAAGASITPTWQADVQAYAMIKTYGAQLSDGELVVRKDIRLTVAHFQPPERGLSMPPAVGQFVIVYGDVRTVLGVQPVYQQGVITQWLISAR